MQSFPLVSILIPAFNHEAYVVETLESILNDGYPNKEIFIIDDGSSDKTAEVIQKWIDENSEKIKIEFFKQKNQGVCATLNKLVKHSNAKYCLIIASDDNLISGSIIKKVEYLQNNPNKLAVFSDAKVIDENSNILYESFYDEFFKLNKSNYFIDKGIRKNFIQKWSIPGGSILYNKTIFEIVGLFDESIIFEDWDYALRMASKNLVGFIDGSLSEYRWHTQNSTKIYSRNIKKSVLFIYGHYITVFKNILRFKPQEYIYFNKALQRQLKEPYRNLFKMILSQFTLSKEAGR